MSDQTADQRRGDRIVTRQTPGVQKAMYAVLASLGFGATVVGTTIVTEPPEASCAQLQERMAIYVTLGDLAFKHADDKVVKFVQSQNNPLAAEYGQRCVDDAEPVEAPAPVVPAEPEPLGYDPKIKNCGRQATRAERIACRAARDVGGS